MSLNNRLKCCFVKQSPYFYKDLSPLLSLFALFSNCMNLTAIRKTLLTLLVCSVTFLAKAQVGYDFARFDAGVSGSINTVYGDAESTKSTPSINFSLNYNQTPFINYILEAQFGRIQGGSIYSKSGRYFDGTFSSFAFRFQLQAGEFIDYSNSPIVNGFKNFYVGSGLGMIYSKMSSINRYSYVLADFYTGGEDSASELFLPIRVGYEFKIFNNLNEPGIKIDLAYQYNHIFGDELDGFKSGHKGDALSQLTLGVKFSLGGVTSYRKQIYYQ